MTEAFVRNAVRTPVGRHAGGLAPVRNDDLGALPPRALMARDPGVDWAAVEESHNRRARTALATMCIGLGQGIAMVLERI